MGDPEGSYRNISLEHIRNGKGADGQVVAYNIMCLDAILYKKVMSTHSIANILLHQQVMHTMDNNESRVRLVYCVSSGKRCWNIAYHVEMDTVSSDYLRLTTLSKLTVGYMRFKASVRRAHYHQVRSIPSISR